MDHGSFGTEHVTGVAVDVFDGILLCCPFSHEMSWMRSGTETSQFQRHFLPTLVLLLSSLRRDELLLVIVIQSHLRLKR